MIRLTLLLSVLSLVKLSTQPVVQGQVENTIAVDYISSVEFGHPSVDLTLPIVDLNSGGQLRLDFDDLEGGYKTYLYRIIHCDRNWYPTETLDEIQYIDGFNDEEVPGFSYSTNAYSDYTHYDVSIPNDDITWLLSGNYALIIYEEDMEVPVLIRKFIVAESMVSSMAEIIRPRKTSKSHSPSGTLSGAQSGEGQSDAASTRDRSDCHAKWQLAYCPIRHKRHLHQTGQSPL